MSSAFMAPPDDYAIIESNDMLSGGPELVTRFRWRANRRVRKMNAARVIPSYHFRVVRARGRYEVRAFQNYLKPLP